ncbi:MAG: autotransporter-associated beta strand repeat-containing protein [Thermoguttaceae bacterium]|jgi:autotransporter-associated beta strand protein
MRCLKFFLLGLAFVVLLNCSASAASLTWKGDGVNNYWNTSTSGPKNWLNGLTPAYFTSGDIVTFDDTGSNAVPINLTDSTNPLTWASGTAGGSVIVNSGKNYTFSGVGSLNGGSTTLPFLVKSGTGTLTINTVNDYKGTTVINGGKLSITGGGKLYYTATGNPASAAITVNSGGTLEFEDYSSGGSFGGLSNYLNMDFAVNGGTLRFAGASDSTGTHGFLIGAGGATLESATPGVLWTIANGGSPYPVLIYAGTNPTDVITLTGAGNGRLDKFISPAGSAIMGLTKSGAGTWTLTEAASSDNDAGRFYTGATTINQGTLILDPYGSGMNPQFGVLYGTSGITINSGGTLQLNGSNAITGYFTGDTNIPVPASPKPVVINGGTLDTQTGYHQIGTLTLNGGLVKSGTPSSPSNGSLIINGDVSVTDNSTISALYFSLNGGSRTFTVADGKTLNFSGTFFNGTSLTKAGSGTMTLGGSNPYAGAVTVNAGTLKLGAAGSISSATAIDVKQGAAFDVSTVTGGWKLGASQQLAGSGSVTGSVADIAGSTVAIAPGDIGSAGTLSFSSSLSLNLGSSDTIYFDLAQSTAGVSDLINVAGNFNANNSSKIGINVSLLQTVINSGTYPLIKYASLTGSTANLNLTVNNGSTRQTYSLTSTGSEIDLSVAGNPANLTWKGDSSLNKWDINTTKNWTNASTSDYYINGDLVTFDGTGSNSPNVNISTTVQPGSITFKNNSTKNYTFSGAGYISGSTGITLASTNTTKAILANTGVNDFIGPITISGGTLEFGNGVNSGVGNLPSGVAVTDNATLSFNNPSGDSLTVSNAIGGTGNLQKNGSGTLTLTGSSSSFTGTVTVNAGQLIAGNANALGSTTVASAITVNSGGTLDINGIGLGSRMVSIQGSGYDGNGALVSNNGSLNGGIYSTTLTGDTTIGGSGMYYLLWSLNGGGYNLTKTGSNEVNIYWAGSTNLGNITINTGTLTVQGNTTLGSTGVVTINGGGTLNLSSITSTISKSVSAYYGSTIQSIGNANTFAGPITLYDNLTVNTLSNLTLTSNIVGSDSYSGSLTKTGSGILILTGTGNYWANGTTINTGTLQIGDGGANGSLPADGIIYNNSALAFNSSRSLNIGAIYGNGNLYQNGSGTVTLTSANNYSGNTIIANGTLTLGSAASISNSPVLDVKSGGTLNVAAVSGGFALNSGQTLTGSGTVTGNVADSYSSIISPGDGLGTLTFNQNLTLAGGDNVSYEINGTSADSLNVKGNFNYNSGVTTINILANKVVSGTAYTFASVTGSLSGALSNLSPDTGDTRYTFTPSLVGKNILLTASGANKSLVWNLNNPGMTGSWDLKSSPSWNTSDVFYNADDVTFNSTISDNIYSAIGVSIDVAVRPASVTVDSSAYYSFTGAGKITGNVGLTKRGTGLLYLSTANDYTGDTVIENGTVVFSKSAAYTSLTGNIVVQNGASLNLRLFSEGNDSLGNPIPPVPITTLVQIAGAGYNNQGALFIGIAPNPNYGIMTKLELTGDATIGNSQGGQWAIYNSTPSDPTTGYIKGHGYTLTTNGVGAIYLNGLGDTGLGDIIVNGGGLGIQESTGLGIASKTLTVNNFSSLTLLDTGNYGVLNKNFHLYGSSNVVSYYGSANFLAGNTILEGAVNFTTDANLTLTGNLTDATGNSGIIKQATGTLTLAGTQNYSGNTSIIAGTLTLSGAGAIGDVANSSTLEILDGNHTLSNLSGSSSTTVVDAGANLTVTSIAQDTLTIGAGATLTIAAIPGGPLSGSASLAQVPEPGTWLLLSTAFFALFAYAAKRGKIRN